MAWAGYPADALTGSNRALLFLILFALFAITPWRPGAVGWLLVLYTLAIGLIGALLLIATARGHGLETMFSEGRLVSPTGYFNSDAALFTMAALLGVALAVRRELPVLLRGVLLAIACGGAQLALLAESRGWLFTLPLLLALSMLVVRDRLRVAVAALLPIAGTLLALHRLLEVFRASQAAHPSAQAIRHAAQGAGRLSLLICGAVLLFGALLAATDRRFEGRTLRAGTRRLIGAVATVLTIAIAAGGGLAATHGHPIPFVKRQWNGFTHPAAPRQESAGSHFATVGTGRYDAWRVALDAVRTHPLGGLGQDNFGDYYDLHRKTDQEFQWVHSFGLRLLAHTGIVGTILFLVFLIAALVCAVRARRWAAAPTSAIAGAAILPLWVWLIHGSVDWFWEIPALSGPALGFLAIAASLGSRPASGQIEPSAAPDGASVAQRSPSSWVHPRRLALPVAGVLAVVAAVFVLGFPYLSVRDVSSASDIRSSNPAGALSLLSRAASLNPLDAEPPRLAGTIALMSGRFVEAERRFAEAAARQPGGWFAWFGQGLAASVLGDSARARQDFRRAAAINNRQVAVTQALARANSIHPLTPSQALSMLVLAH
jgi:hypothetical protein